MLAKRLSPVWWVALGVAWVFDLLFWKKPPGISFAIFVFISLAAGLALAWAKGVKPKRASSLILIPIALFAVMSFIRQEPFTLLLNYCLTLALMALLAHTFSGGRWMDYGVVDYFLGGLRLAGSALGRAMNFWLESRKSQPADPEVTAPPAFWKRSLPFLRGMFLALPFVLLFAALLASADPIFSHRLSDFLALFNLEKIPEYAWRLTYILVLAYLLVGIYLHALTSSQDKNLIGLEKPLVLPFLGLAEAGVVLGSVDLLFSFFVGIQFRYFFGGHANISYEGYTYAEYARRGFGELIVVAFFSLLLYLGLSAVSRRKAPGQRKLFSVLGLGLVVLVMIILVSAFQRLLLYEQAYGFSRLRTYTHVLMIWMGILLLVVAGLELFGRLRYFVLGSLLVILGFAASLNLMNVDSFIVRQNVQRALAGTGLDAGYLSTLSADAIPTLVEQFNSPAQLGSLKDELGSVLACQAVLYAPGTRPLPWQSFTLARFQAQTMLQARQAELRAYPVHQDDSGRWVVKVSSGERVCFYPESR